MPPSQLKQLKASLRDNGILGPQKSKKQKKASSKDASRRLQRNAALEGIRERFNPFEVKAPARREKFEISSNKPTKRTIERPGVTRGLGEERRRETLLKEIQGRNKVGGMLDRRFGEDDPNMTPEQKAAERFAQQAMRTSRKNAMFNLEDDEDEELQLTHGGRALDLDRPNSRINDLRLKDDFDEDVEESDSSDFDAQDDRPRKRVRLGNGASEEEEEEETEPVRKKTKNEVMQEVMAKSKAYKAARQAQKEDDDELRAQLDQGMSDVFAALQGKKPVTKQLLSPPATDSEPTLDPSRAAMLAGKSREEAEKEYEANIRQLKMEARSKPSTRTIPDDEKAAQEKARLEELERKRVRRMKGEAESSDDESEQGAALDGDDEDLSVHDDAEAFGLDQPQPRYMPQLEVEEEDEFVMDDIVASESEADVASDFDDDESSEMSEPEDDGDDDFINGLALPASAQIVRSVSTPDAKAPSKSLPYTFGCPQDLMELQEETKDIKADDLSVTVQIICFDIFRFFMELQEETKDIKADDLSVTVQRIRALYHKSLAEGNSEKLGKFGQALVFWIPALVNGECPQYPSMRVIEQLIRHLHSMAKAQPLEVAAGFRQYLRRFIDNEQISLTPGDLTMLTAISTIFPTSDQWHVVVTPAMLVMSRYLAQAQFEDLSNLATGLYVCTLLMRYQMRSERYVPEAVNFICRGINTIAPNENDAPLPKQIPAMPTTPSLRIKHKSSKTPSTKIDFNDIRDHFRLQHDNLEQIKDSATISLESLLFSLVNLVIPIVDLYTTQSAFSELVSPLQHLVTTRLAHPKNLALLHKPLRNSIASLSETLDTAVKMAVSARKPLFLHNHRPLAVKSAYPLFSTDYNPERRQRDPDAERAELNKLKAEHKKERKGAMRELRKDANFMAREQLREKKVRDEAYDKKFKRLVAEIQGEEGREAKEYEREKAKRKGRF